MTFVYFYSRLSIFYNSQKAKNWHEGTFRYGECYVYYFNNKNDPRNPKTPQKNPKNPKKLKISNFQNMSCGVSLERYGSGEQF